MFPAHIRYRMGPLLDPFKAQILQDRLRDDLIFEDKEQQSRCKYGSKAKNRLLFRRAVAMSESLSSPTANAYGRLSHNSYRAFQITASILLYGS